MEGNEQKRCQHRRLEVCNTPVDQADWEGLNEGTEFLCGHQ